MIAAPVAEFEAIVLSSRSRSTAWSLLGTRIWKGWSSGLGYETLPERM